MNQLMPLAVALAPCAAYAVLAFAHTLLVWRRRRSEQRGVVLIDIAVICAYGVLTGFYVITDIFSL